MIRPTEIETFKQKKSTNGDQDSQAIIIIIISSSSKRRSTDSVSKKYRISSAELKATVMVVIICVTSMFEHSVLIACNLYPYFNELNSVTFLLYFLAVFVFNLKHSSNFSLFFLFNKQFKKVFLKYLRLAS